MQNNETMNDNGEERWGSLTIKGREFLVSDSGRIIAKAYSRIVNNRHGGKNIRRSKEKEVSFSEDGYGYYYFSFRSNGGHYNCYVHRAVAMVFCDGFREGLVVNHKDFNVKNNDYRNLEWCTNRENVIHAIPRMSKRRKKCKKTKTGEKYIMERVVNGKTKYRVCVWGIKGEKTFWNLQDAIEHRNALLRGEERSG